MQRKSSQLMHVPETRIHFYSSSQTLEKGILVLASLGEKNKTPKGHLVPTVMGGGGEREGRSRFLCGRGKTRQSYYKMTSKINTYYEFKNRHFMFLQIPKPFFIICPGKSNWNQQEFCWVRISGFLVVVEVIRLLLKNSRKSSRCESYNITISFRSWHSVRYFYQTFVDSSRHLYNLWEAIVTLKHRS